MTLIDIINKILVRLRETEISSITGDAYASLLAQFVNISKDDAEASWTWRVLRTTTDVTTAADGATVLYTLTGSGNSFKPISVWNVGNKVQMVWKSDAELDMLKIQNPDLTADIITYFAFRGVDGSGDAQIEVWPKPTAVNTIRFRVYKPQAELGETDTITIPWRPVMEAALAMAIEERGEDGGTSATKQMEKAKSLLSDVIGDDMSLTGDDEQTFQTEAPVGGGW